MSALRLAPRTVNVERRAGNIYLRSPEKLAPYGRCITEWLVRWSDKAPERTFLAERKGDGWRKVSYREAYGAARRIGQALLERGLSAERPVAILSDNSIDHALLALGAMHVGIPAAPISPAYSRSRIDPGLVSSISATDADCSPTAASAGANFAASAANTRPGFSSAKICLSLPKSCDISE